MTHADDRTIGRYKSNSSSLCSYRTETGDTHETSKFTHVPSKQLYKLLFRVLKFWTAIWKSVCTVKVLRVSGFFEDFLLS